MSNTQNDGGPAFPCEYVLHRPGNVGNSAPIMEHSPGMYLRDWFAGRYITGAWSVDPNADERQEMASQAYAFADAMIAAREGRS